MSPVHSAGITNAIQPLAQPTYNLPLQKLSADTDIDPRFTIISSYNFHAPLPQLSCLFNALDGLALLASKDFNGRMRGLSGSFSSRYPDVVLQILPPPNAQDFETRFAIWGLHESAVNMLLKSWYIEAVFDLYWEDNQVRLSYFGQGRH